MYENHRGPFIPANICRVKTNEGFPGQFISTMEVNYGCTQSPTLFGLCVDQLGK